MYERVRLTSGHVGRKRNGAVERGGDAVLRSGNSADEDSKANGQADEEGENLHVEGASSNSLLTAT